MTDAPYASNDLVVTPEMSKAFGRRERVATRRTRSGEDREGNVANQQIEMLAFKWIIQEAPLGPADCAW